MSETITRKALCRLADEGGRLYEIPLLIVLLVVSLAVGLGQYERHGWTGLVLGTLLTMGGVVGAVFALIGIAAGSSRMNQRLQGSAWYLTLRSLFKGILFFLFFSIWGGFFSLIVVSLFEVREEIPEWLQYVFALGIGLIWMILHRRLQDSFWQRFWRFSGLVALGGVAVVIAMFVGPAVLADPVTLTRCLQILFFMPSVAYVVLQLRKKPRPSPDQEERARPPVQSDSETE